MGKVMRRICGLTKGAFISTLWTVEDIWWTDNYMTQWSVFV